MRRAARIAGGLRLSFAHPVNHLDPTQDRPSGCHRLKPEHRSDPSLDGTMILFDAIVQVGISPDPDRLQLPSNGSLLSAPLYNLDAAFRR
jgi:hypothetical protein